MTLLLLVLLPQDPGSLVALWVTNRCRMHRFVVQQLLPAWGLQHAATWLWLKVGLLFPHFGHGS